MDTAGIAAGIAEAIGAGATLLWLSAGVLLGVGLLRLARQRGPDRERWVLGIGLLAAAALYVAFAGLTADGTALLIAAAGVVFFAALAHVGVWMAPSVLALGWALHGLWDVMLHVGTPAHPATAPGWYAALCLGFDVVVAVGVVGRLRVWRATRPGSGPVSRLKSRSV